MRPRRSERLVRPRRGAVPDGGAEEDRISGLPTDLLLQILLRLRCAAAAARAGLVSRRLRGLWALLPEIYVSVGNSGGALDAFLGRLESARAASADAPPLALLHVQALCDRLSTRVLASWLRRAARLAPEELKLSVTGSYSSSWPSGRSKIELPCSTRTASIELELRKFNRDLRLEPPRSGDFLALERLSLKGFHFDPAALLPRCPSLRALRIGIGPSAQTPAPRSIHSPSLEELVVVVVAENAHETGLDIVAPELKRMSLAANVLDLKVSASNLEKLVLDCSRNFGPVELGNMGQRPEVMLSGISLWGQNMFQTLAVGYGVNSFVQQLPRLHRLLINIALRWHNSPRDRLLKLPKTSIRMLQLSTYGHDFDGTILHLLKMVKGIEELTIFIDSTKESCSIRGCCRRTWTSFYLSLPLLKRIYFKGFTGSHSAINVLKLLFTSAKALQQMTLTLWDKDSTGREGLKQQLCDIFNLYPTVKCRVLDA